jgi:hypothetical protein
MLLVPLLSEAHTFSVPYLPEYINLFYLYGAETWTLRKADQKYLKRFEMWCWRRMGKISWTDRVRNKEVLQSQRGEECPIQ